jgi:hypothetical protein
MEKVEFITALKAYLEAEDPRSVDNDVKDLKVKFNDFILEEERLHQIAQLEAAEKGEKTSPYFDSLNDDFFELYTVFRNKRKTQQELQKTTENECLKQKLILIDRLKKVIEEEEQIGAAYSAQKEIQEKWKNIGDIPRDKRQEVQQTYSRLTEQFFYNIKIYKELKDHDLHRNKQLKETIIEKLEALASETKLKEIESNLKLLQNEWEETGPTFQSEWDALKETYWTKVKVLYDLIRDAYEKKRLDMAQNIVRKNELIEKVKELVTESVNSDSHSSWQQWTEKLIAIQEDWKKIGFGARKENETVWAEFRKECDVFFANKKVFYESRKSDFDEIKQKKEALIEEAAKFSDSTEWKSSTEKILKLQERWKKAGNAGPKNEQKLWKAFRSACDAFFQNKQAHFQTLDAENETNLTQKEAIIEAIKAYQKKTSKKDTLTDLKAFATEFNAIGNVPFKEKDRIYDAFKKALDTQYATLDLKEGEKESVLFQVKIDTLKSNPNAGKLFDQEKRSILHEIQKIKTETIQLENNIGFFARSKGADALKKEIEQKIEKAKAVQKSLEAKLRLIPNE